MGRKAREALVPRCPKCGGELLPGVAHQCLVAEAKGITVSDWWKPFLGIILALVLQLGGAIWGASKVQTTIEGFKLQLEQQQRTIERIDSYFRRPPP